MRVGLLGQDLSLPIVGDAAVQLRYAVRARDACATAVLRCKVYGHAQTPRCRSIRA